LRVWSQHANLPATQAFKDHEFDGKRPLRFDPAA